MKRLPSEVSKTSYLAWLILTHPQGYNAFSIELLFA